VLGYRVISAGYSRNATLCVVSVAFAKDILGHQSDFVFGAGFYSRH
jgi:hypothetical protein